MRREFPTSDRVAFDMDEDGVGMLRLARPDKLNALDLKMFEALVDAGSVLHDMPGLRCLVLTGEGRGFSAGLDLSTMNDIIGPEARPLTERTHGNANLVQQSAMQWRKLPVPVIAAIHGPCLGGGLQIASGADIRVVAPDARLSIMEMRWGIIPDVGGYANWRGTVRDDVLRELTYTNREFSGEEAVALGIATIVDADPLARATAIAREIAARSPSAIRAAKALFNRHREMSVEEVLMEESVQQQRLLGGRNQVEAVRSQMEKRKADFTDP